MVGEAELARLGELTARYGLGRQQGAQLQAVLEILTRDPLAPTTLRSAQQAIDGHIADSLVALELEPVRYAGTIADLGSGAGFPGLPLAVALPGSHVWLLESQARKCRYLEAVLAEVGVANASVACGRAEEWSGEGGGVEVVVARALGAQPVVVEYAAPLLRRGGLLVDWRGRRAREEERKAAGAGEQLGLRRLEIRKVEPFAGARDRHLHLYLKVSETPPGFPRRAGMARKRPLGGRV